MADLKTGVIYRDDNLARLKKLPAASVDLIYLDPPFFSNRTYEVIWGDESEIRSFQDRWKGGIGHYIGWICGSASSRCTAYSSRWDLSTSIATRARAITSRWCSMRFSARKELEASQCSQRPQAVRSHFKHDLVLRARRQADVEPAVHGRPPDRRRRRG